MNDLEPRLRDLFEEKAREATGAPIPSPGLMRRGRRRQVGTAIAGALTFAAVVGLSVVGLGAIHREDTGPPPAVDRSQAPEPTPSTTREPTVVVDGTDFGVDWIVSFTGAADDDTSCIQVTGDVASDPLCPAVTLGQLTQPALQSWAFEHLLIRAGPVPSSVVQVRFVSEDGSVPAQTSRCGPAPSGWPDVDVCAIALPPEGFGTFEYLDAEGAVMSSEGFGWPSTPGERELVYYHEGVRLAVKDSFMGSSWKVVLGFHGAITLTIDGRTEEIGTIPLNAPVVRPLNGRYEALAFVLTDLPVDQVTITSEGSWDGRWMPSADGGAEARLWIVELPGAGTGSLTYDGHTDMGSVSWP